MDIVESPRWLQNLARNLSIQTEMVESRRGLQYEMFLDGPLFQSGGVCCTGPCLVYGIQSVRVRVGA